MIFLDTETTWFEKNKIIEIAYIKWEERYEKRFWLEEWDVIELEAMAIHHITPKMLEGKKSFAKDEDYPKLLELMQNEIMVCHNMKYDYDSVLNKVYNIEVPRRICTLKVAKRLLPDVPRHNLQYLRYYFDLEFSERIDPHAAISDVIVLEWVYNKLLEIAKEKYSDKSEEEIIEYFIKIEQNPVLLWMVDFWKHKWSYWKDLPKDYLEWIASKEDFGEDAIYTAKYYLAK